ncbi:hypothetical protein K492DRAFT_202823 [Lichtheimia hyalospora FSU 10163]|nr:hypothetical protein K492DRAFT_202823 [Lichtheimia hyalospora FSU 10163]
MQRILASTGRRSKLALGIELDDWTYYYAGDTVKGHIVLESPKSIKINRVRMVWMGLVRVQLEPGIQDEHELFREVCNVDLPVAAAMEAGEEEDNETAARRRREAFRNAATATTAYGMMIPISNPSPVFSLEADKQYRFPFVFVVPSNTPLPSCTESETSTNGIVEYTIEAQVEQKSTDFAAPTKARINVPVLQGIDTLADELDTPQSSQVYCHSEEDDDQSVSVTVDLKHFTTFQRPNAVIIALIRVARIVCKGVSYLLSDSVVHYVKADIDVTQESGFTQTIVRSILVPGTITPTIEMNGQLLEVSYKVRVRAQLQETSYELPVVNFPSDFQSLTGMTVEIPIIVGTLPVSPTHTPMSPISPRFVKPFEPEPFMLPDDASLDGDTESRVKILRKLLRRTSSAGSTQTLPIMSESHTNGLTVNTKANRRSSNVSLSLRNSMLVKTITNGHDGNSSSSSNNDASATTIGTGSSDTATSTCATSGSDENTVPTSQSPVVVLSPSSSSASPPKIEDTYRLSVGPSLSSWFDQHYMSTATTATKTPHPPHEHINSTASNINSSSSRDNDNNDSPAPLFIRLSSSSHAPHEYHVDPKQQDNHASIIVQEASSHLSMDQDHPPTISVPPLLKSQDPQRRKKEDQERQVANHLEQSQLDQRHMDGNTYYFYIFDDSEDEEEHQVQTTPTGFLKPNSSTNNLGASEARISMDKPSPQALEVSTFIDKPDQVTDSEEDSSDEDADLLDIISRRDRRIANRMGGTRA